MMTDEKIAAAAARRAQKVVAWLDVIEEMADDLEAALKSRQSEMASVTGTDPEPRHVRCRHPAVNMRGRLCLSCMNTGFVEDADVDGEKIDPYLLDPPSRFGVVQDQSEASRRARNLAQLDDAIMRLERTANQRDGLEVAERTSTRLLRVLDSSHRALGLHGQKVLCVLLKIAFYRPDVYERLKGPSRDPVAVDLLARVVPGNIQMPR